MSELNSLSCLLQPPAVKEKRQPLIHPLCYGQRKQCAAQYQPSKRARFPLTAVFAEPLTVQSSPQCALRGAAKTQAAAALLVCKHSMQLMLCNILSVCLPCDADHACRSQQYHAATCWRVTRTVHTALPMLRLLQCTDTAQNGRALLIMPCGVQHCAAAAATGTCTHTSLPLTAPD